MRRIAPISHTAPAPSAPATRTDAHRTRPVADRWSLPILDGAPGGVHERFARALSGRHPAVVFLAAALTGLLVVATVSVLLGLLVVHVLLGPLGLSSPDNSVIRTMADHRSGALTDLSSVGSQAGGGFVLPTIVGLIAIGSALARRWRLAAFAVFALAIESATYRITTLIVHRDRPGVTRLEDLPVDASYPSGHTAASIAVYSGLVLLLTSRLTDSTRRALAWTFAILMTTFVALSRMYRGMHHPLDVAGGVVVGIGAVLVVLFACRAAGAAARARHAEPTRGTPR
jgi:undecaprenyl-diphosphatase